MSRKQSNRKPREGAAVAPSVELTRELFQAAIGLRRTIEPADYKRYVLPIIFLRFLSLRYEARRAELENQIREHDSPIYGDRAALDDPDEYRARNVFVIPEVARWPHRPDGARGRHQAAPGPRAGIGRAGLPGKTARPAAAHLRRLQHGRRRPARTHRSVLQGRVRERPRRRRPARPHLRILHRRIRQ